jgi:hypothetical protein
MFLSALSEFFDQQWTRLESAVGQDKVNEAMHILETEGLDVSAIDRSCCEELKLILSKKYDEPIASSTRLDKHGWSKAHIQDHMKRFLCDKIRRAGDLMRQTLGANVGSDGGSDGGPEGPEGPEDFDCDLEEKYDGSKIDDAMASSLHELIN